MIDKLIMSTLIVFASTFLMSCIYAEMYRDEIKKKGFKGGPIANNIARICIYCPFVLTALFILKAWL